MGSAAFCLASVHHVLRLANPEDRPWLFSNDDQRRFFAAYGEAAADFASPKPWLAGKVTNDALELQTWLAERGWPHPVLPIPPDGLAIASVFDLAVAWKEPGSRTSIAVVVKGDEDSEDVMSIEFDGVEMRSSLVRAHRLAGHPTPMFEIDTQSPGWKVMLVEAAPACSPLDLTAAAVDLLTRTRKPFAFSKLLFPVVEMRADVDVSWLEGLRVEAEPWRISDARKKVSLRVDEQGARARSVTEAYVTIGMDRGVYAITTPFLIVFWREEMRVPAFVALSNADSWLPQGIGC